MSKKYTHMRIDLETKSRLEDLCQYYGQKSMLSMLRLMLKDYEDRVDETFDKFFNEFLVSNGVKDCDKKSKEEK